MPKKKTFLQLQNNEENRELPRKMTFIQTIIHRKNYLIYKLKK